MRLGGGISLRTRILFVSLLSTTVVVALFSYFGVAATRESTERTLQERLVIAQQAASSMGFFLEQASHQIGALASERIDLADPGTFDARFLESVVRQIPFAVDHISIIDASGTVRATDPDYPVLIGSSRLGFEHVRESLNTNRASVGNVVFDADAKKSVFFWVIPFGEAGKASGIVEITVDPAQSNVGRLVQSTGLGKTGYMEVVDGTGVVLATSKRQHLLQESDHGSLFATLIKEGKTAVSTCHSCHDGSVADGPETELITFSPLSGVSWGVVVRQSEEEALAPSRSLQERLLIFGPLSFMLAFLVAWVMAGGVTRSINSLTVASQKIADGDLTQSVEAGGKDEVGVLARSLETMRVKLKSSIERIQQRTRELESLNITASTISQSLDLNTILGTTLDKVMEFMKAEIAGILLLDQESETLSYRVHRGFSDRFVKALSNVRIGEGIAGKVAENGQPIMVEDISSDPRVTRTAVGEEGLRAFISVPLRSKERVIGVMNFASKSPGRFTPQDLQFLTAIGNQMGVAVENAYLYDELQQKEEMRSELLRQVITAQEEERKRIARELHDETSQALAALAVKLETIAKMPGEDMEKLKANLRSVQSLAVRTLDEVHRLIFDLRPSLLDDLGLVPAIKWYAQTRLQQSGVDVEVETVGEECRLPGQIETSLFRIGQEAISNIAAHAEAKSVHIKFEFAADSVILYIEDDGHAFELSKVRISGDKKRGLGLLGMRERAELCGGKSYIQSTPGKGTLIKVEIPVDSVRSSNERDKSVSSR